MKLIDLVKVMDGNSFITVEISLYGGLCFKARHPVSRFLEQGGGLVVKEIDRVYAADGELNIKLKN